VDAGIKVVYRRRQHPAGNPYCGDDEDQDEETTQINW
jgi:hypothetical protein